jgi:hypothetical protein
VSHPEAMPHQPAGWRLSPQDPTACPGNALPPFRRSPPRESLRGAVLIRKESARSPSQRSTHEQLPEDIRLRTALDDSSMRDRQVLLRKEVIQPHLPVRLPCYDFVPIADPTFDGSLHEGWATGFGCYRLS